MSRDEEFVAAQRARLQQICIDLGVSPQVAGMIGAEWDSQTRKEWGGERPYIARRPPDREGEKKRQAVHAFCVEGRAVEEVTSSTGVSRATLYRALAERKK